MLKAQVLTILATMSFCCMDLFAATDQWRQAEGYSIPLDGNEIDLSEIKIIPQEIKFFKQGKLKGSIAYRGTGVEGYLIWSPRKDRVGFRQYKRPTKEGAESSHWFMVYNSEGKQVFEREIEYNGDPIALPDDPQLVIMGVSVPSKNSLSLQIRRYRENQLEKTVSINFPYGQSSSSVQLKDGRIILISETPAQIALLNNELEISWERSVLPGRLDEFKLSPDGTLLACYSTGNMKSPGGLQVFDTKNGKELWCSSQNPHSVKFDFIDNNQLLIYGAEEKELNLFDSNGILQLSAAIDIGSAGLELIPIPGGKVILAGSQQRQKDDDYTMEILEIDEHLKVTRKKSLRGLGFKYGIEFRRSDRGVVLKKDGKFFEIWD